MSAGTQRKTTNSAPLATLPAGRQGPQASLSSLALPALSVVIPTLNEGQNIAELLRRLHATMCAHDLIYEAIIIDDHSTDDTVAVAEQAIAALAAPARVLLKQGTRGKTYSLIEGLNMARYEALATLDGDLQYPPESLPDLLAALQQADMVVGDRRANYNDVDAVRGLSSRLFNLLVGRGLLALDVDVQSGMKVFRREIYELALLHPGPWSFDLELLASAHEQGFRIASSPIEMSARVAGQSKVRMARVGVELAQRALAVRLHLATHTAAEDDAARERLARDGSRPADAAAAPTDADDLATRARGYERWLTYEAMEATQARARGQAEEYAEEARQDVTLRGRRYLPFAPHRPTYSAFATFTRGQIITLALVVVVWALAVVAFGLTTLAATLGVITALYLFDLGVTALISVRTLRQRPATPLDNHLVRSIRDEYWPSYTILCPLYHEAEVAAQFVNAIRLLDYPTERLQVLLLTEEDDRETRAALRRMALPAHFEVVTVPDGKPRTKPRACNYGLLRATGDFIVIFDAEDIPDPLQLKKAVLTFAHHGPELACAQASLNFYNPSQNLLTRWFTSEYSLWFDMTLPALQRMKSFLPLGGTSNHFRTRVLREVGGWDAFNVTEDCDLGVRLAQYHYYTAMVDSTTYEEANPNLRNWLRQRSRWVKGYMQTYLTHMRQPMRYLREGRLGEFFWLQVIVGGKPLAQLINPILWLLLATYIVFHQWVTPLYHILFPAPVFYASAFCLVVGNFFYVYSYLIGCLNRRQYLLTLWSLIIPLYWALMSVASYVALWQLLTRPHFWEKTNHGLYRAVERAPHLQASQPREASRSERGATGAAPQPGMALWAQRSVGWLASHLRQAAGAPWAQALTARGAPAGAWLRARVDRAPLLRGALDYLRHEWVMIRRELALRGRQGVTLAPALSLPVAPVVDMLSTALMPAISLAVSNAATGGGAAVVAAPGQRETRYVVAVRPLARPVVAPEERTRLTLLRWLRDPWLVATLLTAIIASVTACVYYFVNGETLIYNDAESHIRLARMPFDSVTPGLAQLGSAWLPLPHMLMWPFIMNDYLWRTGLAGAFVGMVAYIVAALYTFKSARLLSGSAAAAYVGALALLLNPNLLYLQATPMSEAPLLAFTAATIYYFLLWAQTSQTRHLLFSAGCALLVTLTRYEGWSLFVALVVLVVAVNALKRRSAQRIIGETLLFMTPGAVGIGLWFLWNYVFTGNPLFFQNGPYSAESQQALFLHRGQLPTYHNLMMDALTYGADVLEYAGPAIVALAVLGLALYARRVWKRPQGVAALSLLAPLALYLVSLYSGQIVIYVPLISTHVANDLFNVRYATSALIPLGVFVAMLVGRSRPLQLVAVALILAQAVVTTAGGVIALQDGQYGISCLPFTQSDIFLAEHYNGGRILDDLYANADAFGVLGIDYSNVVYVGSYKVWQAALADPAKYVDWVIARPGDAVSEYLNVKSTAFTSQCVEVERDPSGNEIFYKRGRPPLPNRPAPTQLIQRYAQCDKQYNISDLSAPASSALLAPSSARLAPQEAPTGVARGSASRVVEPRRLYA